MSIHTMYSNVMSVNVMSYYLSHCSSLTVPSRAGKKSKCACRKWIFSNIWSFTSLWEVSRFCISSLSVALLFLLCTKNREQTALKSIHAHNSAALICWSNSGSYMSFQNMQKFAFSRQLYKNEVACSGKDCSYTCFMSRSLFRVEIHCFLCDRNSVAKNFVHAKMQACASVNWHTLKTENPVFLEILGVSRGNEYHQWIQRIRLP